MTAFSVVRVLIGGTASGVGKTTFVVGLIRELRSRGLRIATFKCGPDYLDPTYHARASGSPSHNLDGWMMGREAVLGTFARMSANADIAVIEGVMGLYDSASPTSGEGSTAEIAKWLGAPVLLVIDASGMARTIGAIGRGFADFDPAVNSWRNPQSGRQPLTSAITSRSAGATTSAWRDAKEWNYKLSRASSGSPNRRRKRRVGAAFMAWSELVSNPTPYQYGRWPRQDHCGSRQRLSCPWA